MGGYGIQACCQETKGNSILKRFSPARRVFWTTDGGERSRVGLFCGIPRRCEWRWQAFQPKGCSAALINALHLPEPP